MLLLWHKVLLFTAPALLIAGAGVAYHDGVGADPVHAVGRDDVGRDVAVKGRVLLALGECGLKHQSGEPGQCFVLRDLERSDAFVLVTDDAPAPPVDSVAVVRGVLKHFQTFDFSDGCKECGAKARGEVAWVDAGSVAEAWVFR